MTDVFISHTEVKIKIAIVVQSSAAIQKYGVRVNGKD
jgi:hypothetical protein